MTSKEKFNELWDLKLKIESKVFQDNVMKPIFEELDRQKNAYDCLTLRELAKVQGKKQGILFIIDLFKDINNEINNLKDELESQQE